MSATTATPTVLRHDPGNPRVVLRDIPPELYQALVAAKGDQPVRIAYDRGVLELMSPGPRHERQKRQAARFVTAVTEEVGLPCLDLGSTLWESALRDRGIEPDECYLFDRAKIDAVAALTAERPGLNNAADYPRPDLAIEIDIRHSRVDRPAIYAALGVTEIWCGEGEDLRIEVLGPDGLYHPSPASPSLRVTAEEVFGWIDALAPDLTPWSRDLRAWIRAQVVPRF